MSQIASCAANFDRVARSYRWLEYLTFGPGLARCRRAQLPYLAGTRRALLLGDGDGRFLARLLASNPRLDADVVDSSQSMLALLERRIRPFTSASIHLHHADFLAWEPAGEYDLIVSHFFLDCFFPHQIELIVDRVLAHAAPGARWVVSEFAVPAHPLTGLLARGIIASLYQAFGWLTGLQVRSLPSYPAAMLHRGLVLTRQRRFLAGLLRSELWTVTTPR